MKIKNMKKEELELYTYTDIAEMLLSESKKPMSTADIFKKICESLEMAEDEYKAKIGDFYTSMTTDKRFVSLENALWDLRDRHAIEIEIPDDDEDEEENIDEELDESQEDDENIENEEDVDDDEILDDDIDDDMEDLSIISEDELEEEN